MFKHYYKDFAIFFSKSNLWLLTCLTWLYEGERNTHILYQHWPLLCLLYFFFFYWFFFNFEIKVSTLHLCCISVDRYFAIIKPFDYRHYMNTRWLHWRIYKSIPIPCDLNCFKVLPKATIRPFFYHQITG